MSKRPVMPKLKHLRPMAPDDPFYRRGYVVGVGVLRLKPSGSSPEPREPETRIRGGTK